MKGICTKALMVTLVLSNVQSFSMVESFKQHVGSVAQGATALAHKAIQASKAQPYAAAGIGLGVLGVLGLSKYAYSKYQARKAENANRDVAVQAQREEFAKAVDAVLVSLKNAKSDNNSAVFTGRTYQERIARLKPLSEQINKLDKYAAITHDIGVYAAALEEYAKALHKKSPEAPNLRKQADAQYTEVVTQLDALKAALQNPVAQPTSTLSKVAKWTGLSALAAGAAYGAFKLWNWYKG